VEKYGTAREATDINMVQPIGHRYKYGTAREATDINMVQPERPQI
jgi:hypothetical protein